MAFRILTFPFRLLSDAFGMFGPLFTFAFGILPFVFYYWVAVLCTQYDVCVLLHHAISVPWAALIALLVGPVTITLALILKILSLAGSITGLIL